MSCLHNFDWHGCCYWQRIAHFSGVAMSTSPLQTLLEERLNAARGLGWGTAGSVPAGGIWLAAAAYVAALLQRLRVAV